MEAGDFRFLDSKCIGTHFFLKQVTLLFIKLITKDQGSLEKKGSRSRS